MKNTFVAGFFLILVISVLYFDFLEWNQFDDKTRLVAISYYADNCPSCATLRQKMYKVEWIFAQKPIVFIHYDIHKKQALRRIQRIGFYEQVQKEMGAGFVIVYDRTKQTPLLKITADSSWEEIQEEINYLLTNDTISSVLQPLVN